jgi:lipid-A-disaccharide synthase
MGGDHLANAGAHIVKHIRETNFMGFVEVARNLGRIRRMFAEVKSSILAHKPQVVVLVDYPGFNLRMAKWVKSLKGSTGLDTKVVYYISPQLWAWKSGRVEAVRRYVDEMLTILPFEPNWYKQRGVQVTDVGHPLLDVLLPVRNAPPPNPESLGFTAAQPVVAMLPGSRRKELERILPPMLAASASFSGVQFALAAAPTVPNEWLKPYLANYPSVKVVRGNTYTLLRMSQAAWVKSGTSTLETALLGTPFVVCYRGDALSYRIARWVVGGRIKYIGLPNLILDRPAYHELIQNELNATNLTHELQKLLTDEACITKQKAASSELWQLLGSAGASERAANRVRHWLMPNGSAHSQVIENRKA